MVKYAHKYININKRHATTKKAATNKQPQHQPCLKGRSQVKCAAGGRSTNTPRPKTLLVCFISAPFPSHPAEYTKSSKLGPHRAAGRDAPCRPTQHVISLLLMSVAVLSLFVSSPRVLDLRDRSKSVGKIDDPRQRTTRGWLPERGPVVCRGL